MMRISCKQSFLLNRLIGSAYPVAIEILGEIIHSSNLRQNLADHKVIFIENLLGQRLAPILHKLGAEGGGVYRVHLMHTEALGFAPSEYPVLGQYGGIVY